MTDVIANVQVEPQQHPLLPLVRHFASPTQWSLLCQQPEVWCLPDHSLLHWLFQTRALASTQQVTTLQQLFAWQQQQVLVSPPDLTTTPSWMQLREYWIAQGVLAGWLQSRAIDGGWSLWQLLSADGAGLLTAMGFGQEIPALQQSRWCAVFLLSDGKQDLLIDCAQQRVLSPKGRDLCLFRLSFKVPLLVSALAAEAATFDLTELQLLAASSLLAARSPKASAVLPQAAQGVTSDGRLCYWQLSQLFQRKAWILQFLPQSTALAPYRRQLNRHMPWLYRQLWPLRVSLPLLVGWIRQQQLQQLFVSANAFETALLFALSEGLTGLFPNELCLTETALEPDSQAAVAESAQFVEEPTTEQRLFWAQQQCQEAGKSFILSELSTLVSEWQQQCEQRVTPQPMSPLLEHLKVLFLLLHALPMLQLREVLDLCPWLLLLLPAARKTHVLEAALRQAPALAEVLWPELTATQRLLALRLSPQLILTHASTLQRDEYWQLVTLFPWLAVAFPAWATPTQLAKAIAEKPVLFAQLPPAYQNAALFDAMVATRGSLLAELPMAERTFQRCHSAISQQLTALEFVPDAFERELNQLPSYWPFYQQSYQWAQVYQPELANLFEQALTEFCRYRV